MFLRRLGLGAPSGQLALVLVPAAVAACMLALSGNVVGALIGTVLGFGVFLLLQRRPGIALVALVAFMPCQLMGLALLLGRVPTTLLRPAGGITEILALSILAAGLQELHASGRKLDRIDIALLLYVAVVTIFLLLPHGFSPGASESWTTRLYGWRSDAGYPLLFFGIRHAPISARTRERFLSVIVGLGVVIAGLALYQEIAPTSWSNFILNTDHLGIYEAKVASIPPYLVIQELEYLFFVAPLRVSSLFASPFDMADYLVLVVAIVAVRIRNDGRVLINYVVLAMAVGGIYYSRVRGDALALVCILVLIALPGSRRNVAGRLRLIAVLAIGALLIVPSLAGSRYVGAQGASVSNSQHIAELEHGLTVITTHPLGLGLGAEPSDRSSLIPGNSDTSENAFLQVFDELGIEGALPWIAMMGFVLVELKRRASAGDVVATCMGWALVGILIGGLTHHVFLTLPVPWTLWCGVGLALSTYREPAPEDDLHVPIQSPAAAGVP